MNNELVVGKSIDEKTGEGKLAFFFFRGLQFETLAGKFGRPKRYKRGETRKVVDNVLSLNLQTNRII